MPPQVLHHSGRKHQPNDFLNTYRMNYNFFFSDQKATAEQAS